MIITQQPPQSQQQPPQVPNNNSCQLIHGLHNVYSYSSLPSHFSQAWRCGTKFTISSLCPIIPSLRPTIAIHFLPQQLLQESCIFISLDATLVQTGVEIPSPRVGHASTFVSSALIVWGETLGFY
ncbi:uncharacterized protein EDB91DRAFT_1170850 [Suillus paluster]|uniref:uncharacterized protein n=1 Tax=Suillus paluster TaxID=48578 RepID=UPI001B87437D|nr:uncharacterized protein EDB91DRAFT_1170850 [Suillus paluster]KAG1724440.1 hypothetical protein EDB91DRAFT_1170850 [Suillus paluster]